MLHQPQLYVTNGGNSRNSHTVENLHYLGLSQKLQVRHKLSRLEKTVCMEKHNPLGSTLAALSGPLRCRRKVRAAARGLEARGRPVGPAVKSTHQSSAAVSSFFFSFFKFTVCIDFCSLDCVVSVLHHFLSTSLTSFPSLSI